MEGMIFGAWTTESLNLTCMDVPKYTVNALNIVTLNSVSIYNGQILFVILAVGILKTLFPYV